MIIRPTILMLFFLLTLSNSATSQTDQQNESHAAIISAVQRFIEDQNKANQNSKFTIHIGRLDSRLQLNACDLALETYLAPGGKLSGKTSVGVRCSSPNKPWALYIPVTVNIISNIYKTVRPLARGRIIQEQDIVSVEYNLSRLNYGYFRNKENLIGKKVKRRLKQGQVITPNQVTEPLMVKRGEKVSLIAKSSNFAIRMNGKAMMNGMFGDRIRVKNISSRRIIEGTVTRNGEVTVYN